MFRKKRCRLAITGPLLRLAAGSVLALPLTVAGLPTLQTQAQTTPGNGNGQYFPQTGHSVGGRFLQYWQQHGGLPQQGYPLSAELQELSPTDGKVYTVQYFERAVFEMHPQNPPPNDVLLSLLGVFSYKSRYPAGAPNQKPNNDPGSVLFSQTGKRVGGSFLKYWNANGGVAQQGYPISDEFQEQSALDGKTYTVQYFERAVFEYHPENQPPNDVLLSQLGTFQFRDRYLNPRPAIPALPNTSRGKLAASDRYLVWSEQSTGPNGSPADDTGDILGLDLQTGKRLPISVGEPNDQTAPDVSGSLVVYETQPDAKSGADKIVGKDLATGQAFTVSTGTATCYTPKIAGRTVAWLEFDNSSQRVMLRDLNTTSTLTITSVPVTNDPTSIIGVGDIGISDEYVLWREVAPWDPRYGDPPRTSYIKAYNRKTGVIKPVVSYSASFGGQSLNDYMLDGHRIVIGGDVPPEVLDLNTGQSTPIDWQTAPTGIFIPAIKGDIVVWSSYSPGIASTAQADTQGLDIWGINLADPAAKPVPLVAGPGNQLNAVISNGKLIWLDKEGPYDQGIGIISLDSAFATSPERLKMLSP